MAMWGESSVHFELALTRVLRFVMPAIAAVVPAAGATTLDLRYDVARGGLPAGELEAVAVDSRGLVLSGLGAGGRSGRYRSDPIEAPFAFTAVGPHWRAVVPPGTGLTLELSTSADGDSWSPFHRVMADEHLVPTERYPDGRPNPNYGDTMGGLTHRSRGDGRWVRLRVTLERDSLADLGPALERLTLTFIDSSRPYEGERQATEVLRSGHRAEGLYPKPPVHSRDAWGARPPTCTYSYCTVTHIGIHHTAGVSEYSCSGFSDCAADVRAIQSYHMDTNGWCDVGYNYLASSDGALWEGRGGGDDVRGAHDGHNCGSMGVANMGYYHPPYDHLWTEAQLDAVAELSAWKCDQKGIDPFGISYYAGYGGNMDNIYGHRDVSATACPGDTIYPRLDELKTRVDDKLAGGGGNELIYDTSAANLVQGDWETGTSANDKYGPDYLWTSTGTADIRYCAWSIDLASGGTYDVSLWWSQGSNRTPSGEAGVKQGSVNVFTINQQVDGGRWNSLGLFSFDAGEVLVGVRNGGPGGYVIICDAVKLTKLD